MGPSVWSCEDCVRLSAQCFANWIERQQVLLHIPVCVLTTISQAVVVERLLVPVKMSAEA
jgi:hypothetical protein